jgi:hypothetical protein
MRQAARLATLPLLDIALPLPATATLLALRETSRCLNRRLNRPLPSCQAAKLGLHWARTLLSHHAAAT